MLWRCLRLLVLGDRSVRLDNECLDRRCDSGRFALGCCVVCGARGAATECLCFYAPKGSYAVWGESFVSVYFEIGRACTSRYEARSGKRE